MPTFQGPFHRTYPILILLLIGLPLFVHAGIKTEEISILVLETEFNHPISGSAIQDAQDLLAEACACKVSLNNKEANIRIIIPSLDSLEATLPDTAFRQFDYPMIPYPQHSYEWHSLPIGEGIQIKLITHSFQGISFGIYGLLQEKLGFLFYHPRQTLKPDLKEWPLREVFHWKARPRFEKRGFHIHSQHPLELTEMLMDEKYPNALSWIKEYIDWLARNQQNYFDFNLLESIRIKKWPNFAAEFVEYGHSRGIIMGVDLSLHMVQQKSFMLYRNFPKSWRPKVNQVRLNTKRLFKADWDVWDMEFSTTEFSSGNTSKKQKLQLEITRLLSEEYGAWLTGREHVVKRENMVAGSEEEMEMDSSAKALDARRGTMIHTVMFYGLNDEVARVYGNQNLHHMREKLLESIQERETWYYPETAYWITFDNSVPMFLMPYLNARLDDILYCDSIGVPGHLTFSSGWEWGYWLMDWSVARWSWEHEYGGIVQEPAPTMYLEEMFQDSTVSSTFRQLASLQQEYLKDRELMQYMVAMTVTDELPGPGYLQLHPRPRWKWKFLRNNADLKVLDSVKTEGIIPLGDFAEGSDSLVKDLIGVQWQIKRDRLILLQELIEALQVTTLRAKHRKEVVSALVEFRRSQLKVGNKRKAEEHLMEAVLLRQQAQSIVIEREKNYRYMKGLIARKRKGHTAYHFGYLYPVSRLHFWKREEEQVKKNKWGFPFMNIWNVWRIVGIIN